MLDDSLILGYKSGKLLGPNEVALSVSVAKMFAEDPMRYYLRKVRRLPDPPGIPLVWGSGGHAAVEALYSGGGSLDVRVNRAMDAFSESVRKEIGRVENPVIRVNPNNPQLPFGKEEIKVDADFLIEKGEKELRPLLKMLAYGWDQYTPLTLQTEAVERVEQTLGKLARDGGMDYTSMRLWHPGKRSMLMQEVAIIAGVPYHGYVDAVLEWPDGTDMIIDHKFVGGMVPYYPIKGERDWRRYEPNYDPASDIQLDIYSYATGIERAGFQFFCKRPQYVPSDGILHPGWVAEHIWKEMDDVSGKLPAAWALSPDGQFRYALVWRPAPQDHPSNPTDWTRQRIMPRVIDFVRTTAQQMTESFILWKAGVEPEIAFMAGHPDDIGKKSCPYCPWGPNGDGECPTPRFNTKTSLAAYKKAKQAREVLCQKNPEIMERRQLWAHQIDELALS